MSDLCQQAIEEALLNNWEKAISINEEIVKNNKNDVEALNRLAYAYTQTGNIEKAKKIYRTTLLVDNYNFIAQKNLNKITSLPKKISFAKNQSKLSPLSPCIFIEEPGRTKTIQLTHLAPKNIIYKLRIGDTIFLCPKKHSIELRDGSKTYLGTLPDDIAFKLLRFLKAGNIYYACIKNIQKNCVSVFIREQKRGKRFINQPTFLSCGHEPSSAHQRETKKTLKDDEEEVNNQEEE